MVNLWVNLWVNLSRLSTKLTWGAPAREDHSVHLFFWYQVLMDHQQPAIYRQLRSCWCSSWMKMFTWMRGNVDGQLWSTHCWIIICSYIFQKYLGLVWGCLGDIPWHSHIFRDPFGRPMKAPGVLARQLQCRLSVATQGFWIRVHPMVDKKFRCLHGDINM